MPTAGRHDLDPRSAIPIAIAFAILAVSVWLVRSIPRTLALTAIASLIAFALMPLVEALRRRTGWKRRYAAAIVLVATGVIAITTLVLVLVPTINQVRTFNREVPKTVDQLGTLPIIGPRLREANASKKVRQWIDDFPKRLDVNTTPIADAASAIADGVAATLVRAPARDHAGARRRTAGQHGPPARSRTPKTRRRSARPARLRRRRPLHRGHACSWPRWRVS